jgi:UDP-glucose 4-epimerase
MESMNVQRCLVLGGSGFIGSHLVELLAEQGTQVRVFGRSTPHHRLGNMTDRVEWIQGEFRDAEALAQSVQGCDYVYHLVGTTKPASSNRDVVFDVETSIVPTLRLLEICVRQKVRQVIFASSGGTVYGQTDGYPIPEKHSTEPQSAYGITKLTIEKYLELFHRIHGLDYAVLRVANCYGPRLPTDGEQGVIGSFLDRLARGEPLILWGDGSVRRDYVYVDDVARAFRASLGQCSPYRVFNIGTGIGTSLAELIELVQEVTGRRTEVVKKPGRQVDIPVNILHPGRAGEYLKWEPLTSLRTGLLRTWTWLVRSQSIRQASAHGQG